MSTRIESMTPEQIKGLSDARLARSRRGADSLIRMMREMGWNVRATPQRRRLLRNARLLAAELDRRAEGGRA